MLKIDGYSSIVTLSGFCTRNAACKRELRPPSETNVIGMHGEKRIAVHSNILFVTRSTILTIPFNLTRVKLEKVRM